RSLSRLAALESMSSAAWRITYLWRKGQIQARAKASDVDTKALPLTEEVNPSTADLDLLGTQELLHRINDEDRRAAWAVEREIGVIATAVDEIANRLRSRG